MHEAQTEVLEFVVREQGTYSSFFEVWKNNSGAYSIIISNMTKTLNKFN